MLFPAGRLYFFEELGIYALLFNIEDISAFELFYNRELGKLIEHDKLNGSQLCKTLEVYFEKNKIIGKTADALYIHRNTLRYRLDKIQSLLGKDFDEVDNLVNINMAFKIKNYMDVFWAATDNES